MKLCYKQGKPIKTFTIPNNSMAKYCSYKTLTPGHASGDTLTEAAR